MGGLRRREGFEVSCANECVLEEEVGGTPKEQRPINHCVVSVLTPSLSDEGQRRGGG